MIFIACTTNQFDIQMHDNDQIYNSFVKRKKNEPQNNIFKLCITSSNYENYVIQNIKNVEMKGSLI